MLIGIATAIRNTNIDAVGTWFLPGCAQYSPGSSVMSSPCVAQRTNANVLPDTSQVLLRKIDSGRASVWDSKPVSALVCAKTVPLPLSSESIRDAV